MRQREQARIQVLNTVLEQHLSIRLAAEIMGISERHTKRLLAAYRKEGVTALAHGNRGRRPHNAVPEDAAAAVVKLASNGYAGANHSHFTELLQEREGIDLSRPTVRRILVKAGLGSPRSRRSQQHRFRRKRMPQEGMLIQVDGSPHPWLEDRADKFVLLLAVDDATSTVAQAVFHTTEDTRGYLVLLEGLVRQWGIPLALYSDRHAAFKYNARQGPVLYESTQFARVMRELGIQQIFAMSPQAKGRVERMASTFQDRLVTERRLAGATTMEEANAVLQEYLPRFNKRFAVAAEQPEKAYRAVPADLDLTETVSIRHTRKVARDNAVKYQWRVLQLLPGEERPSYAGLRVDLLERADGELLSDTRGRPLITRKRRCGPRHYGDKAAAPSPLRKDQRQLKSGSPDIWIETSGSSWRTWSPRWRSGPKPRPLPPRENPFATSCDVRLLPPSRPAGRRCRKPGSRDCPCGPSPGNWACPATPSGNTLKRTVRPPNCSAPRNGPRPRP